MRLTSSGGIPIAKAGATETDSYVVWDRSAVASTNFRFSNLRGQAGVVNAGLSAAVVPCFCL